MKESGRFASHRPQRNFPASLAAMPLNFYQINELGNITKHDMRRAGKNPSVSSF